MPETKRTPFLAAPEAPPARPVIPGFELLRRIGQGSYGEVWLARDATGGYRALKVVYRQTFEHERPFEREFSGIQKFQPVSRIHSSQVAVLEVGRVPEAGLFFYSMELADDQVAGQQIQPDSYVPKTLRSEVKKRGRLQFSECLEIGLALTTALEHLHKHGLIHRDIKPSNIIFVNGVPKLADIGLVTDVGATISYVGTEGFLPPEGPVSPLADIYSLGKVLYEMVTGRDRLDFPELPTLLGNVGEKDRLLELNLVFLKACQNEVRKRYQSAHEMHADLALLQSGRSLRRARALERRLANVTRAAVILGGIGLLAGGAYFYYERQQLAESRQNAELAERARKLAHKETEKTLGRLVVSYVANGSNALAQGDVANAALWWTQAAKEDHGTNHVLHQARIVPLLARCPKPLAMVTHRGPIHALAVSPEGRKFATGSDDHTVQLWNLTTGEALLQPLMHPSPVQCLAFSADDRRMAVGCADGTVQVWNPATGEPLTTPWKPGGAVRRVMFHPSGQWLLTLSAEAGARVWHAGNGQLRRALLHEGTVLSAVICPNGQHIATAGSDGTARLWKFEGADSTPLRLSHDGPVSQAAFSPDSRRLVTVSGPVARLWNVATGEPAEWRMEHAGPVTAAAFSPDGLAVATVGQDRTARLWDAQTGQRQRGLIELSTAARGVAFSPDGRQLLVTDDHHAQLWNVADGQPATPPLPHGAGARDACFSPAGDCLLFAAGEGAARVTEWWSGISLAAVSSGGASPNGSSPAREAAPPRRIVPKDDLLLLTEVLAGTRVDSSGQRTALAAAELRQGWQTLRQKWPAVFRPADTRAWHAREAATSETNQQWFATVFHLDRLMTNGATDAGLRSRRELAAARLVQAGTASPPPSEVGRRIPPRPPTAQAGLLELGTFYNAGLGDTWLPSATVKSGNDLSALPTSVQKFNGVEFDARGIIQLSSSAVENSGTPLPRSVTGIPIQRKLQKLHFLHGAAWDAPHGTVIGGYRIHYANGEQREVKLVFGVNVREWWSSPQQVPITTEAALAWQGANPASRAVGMAVRLYQMTWPNRLPDVEVKSLDFFSTLAKPAPFLLAVTAE